MPCRHLVVFFYNNFDKKFDRFNQVLKVATTILIVTITPHSLRFSFENIIIHTHKEFGAGLCPLTSPFMCHAGMFR